MRHLSITARLTLIVFTLQLVAAMALLVGVGSYVRWRVATQAAADEEVLREGLLATYGSDGPAALAREIALRTANRDTHRAVMLLTDPAGRRIAGNLRSWPAGIEPTDGVVAVVQWRAGGAAAETMRGRVTILPDGTRLVTGVAIQGEADTIRLFGEASVAALATAMLLAALVSIAAARLFVARLSPVVAALESAQHGDFAPRVDRVAGNDSFAALARVTNTTLDRIGDLMADLKLATDTLAHDLKSPIMRLRVALDGASQAIEPPLPDPAPARIAVERAQAEGERLLTIVETALSISRAEGGLGRETFRPVDLATMLEDLAEIYGPVVEECDRAIRVLAPVGIGPVAIHRELLGQALSNLVDNALKYGAGTVTLSLADDVQTVRLTISDQGVGIAADDRAAALRRFGRLDTSRTGSGAGLGLSLVAAVAKLHGGTLSLGDAAPGLAATVTIAR